MNDNSFIELSDRVLREKMAHTDNDVLESSWKLKRLFRHLITSPTMARLEWNFGKYLKNVRELRVLDLGCGHGEQSIILLERGARVSGIDISQRYIDDAIQSAKKACYSAEQYDFRIMDAHSLDFPDQEFDVVIGRGILHHLDLVVSLKEIRRVLKIGGRALFQEPLSANPILRMFRILTPYARTKDEKPLTPQDLDMIEGGWHAYNTYYGLISAPVAVITSVFLRPFDNNFLLRLADWVEGRVNRIPWMRPFNQYVLLNLVRE